MVVSGNYITKTDLLNADVDVGDHNDTFLQDIIDGVESEVEKLTGNKFREISSTKYFDGNGKRVLFFTERTNLPLLSITDNEIYIVAPENGDEILNTLTKDTDFFLDESGTSVELLEDTVTDPRSVFGYGQWPTGTRNVKINGTWGHSSCPLPIKRVCVLMTAAEIDPNYTGLHQVESRDWGQGDVSYKRQITGKRVKTITGYPRIDVILSAYRRRTGSIRAI